MHSFDVFILFLDIYIIIAYLARRVPHFFDVIHLSLQIFTHLKRTRQ